MKKLVRVVDLACLAIVFAIALTESVDAQQLYKKDNCMYQRGSNQLVGCYSWASGRLWYYHVPNKAMRDERTGVWMAERNGVMMIWTTRGWYPMHAHPQGQQIIAEIQAANQQARQQQQQQQQQRVAPGNIGIIPTPGGGTTLVFPPMPAYGPGGGFPGAGAPSSAAGGWETPACRNQRGAPCPGVYDPTPYGDRNTNRDFNPNNRPGNRR
jgi:hypothetical protein